MATLILVVTITWDLLFFPPLSPQGIFLEFICGQRNEQWHRSAF